jgi:hypothetical protein
MASGRIRIERRLRSTHGPGGREVPAGSDEGFTRHFEEIVRLEGSPGDPETISQLREYEERAFRGALADMVGPAWARLSEHGIRDLKDIPQAIWDATHSPDWCAAQLVQHADWLVSAMASGNMARAVLLALRLAQIAGVAAFKQDHEGTTLWGHRGLGNARKNGSKGRAELKKARDCRRERYCREAEKQWRERPHLSVREVARRTLKAMAPALHAEEREPSESTVRSWITSLKPPHDS